MFTRFVEYKTYAFQSLLYTNLWQSALEYNVLVLIWQITSCV